MILTFLCTTNVSGLNSWLTVYNQNYTNRFNLKRTKINLDWASRNLPFNNNDIMYYMGRILQT